MMESGDIFDNRYRLQLNRFLNYLGCISFGTFSDIVMLNKLNDDHFRITKVLSLTLNVNFDYEKIKLY